MLLLATLRYLLSKSINEQDGIFRSLYEKLQAGWNENLKNLSEHALLLGTSEYLIYCIVISCKYVVRLKKQISFGQNNKVN